LGAGAAAFKFREGIPLMMRSERCRVLEKIFVHRVGGQHALNLAA
jgi:hypothetical protein